MISPASAHVIDITARVASRADYRGLASAQVRAARENLGLDTGEFAAWLSSAVGWQVMPAVVGRWEHGRRPAGRCPAGRPLSGETPAPGLLFAVPTASPRTPSQDLADLLPVLRPAEVPC